MAKDELEIRLEYSDLQTKMLTLLEIEKYIINERVKVQGRLDRLKAELDPTPIKPIKAEGTDNGA